MPIETGGTSMAWKRSGVRIPLAPPVFDLVENERQAALVSLLLPESTHVAAQIARDPCVLDANRQDL